MTAALTMSSRLAPVFEQGAAEMGAEQRQHDHPVERDQEAARRRVVDRGDAAFRRGGPQEGAEQEVEGAPVEQRLEDLLAEQMPPMLWGSPMLGQHDAAGDDTAPPGRRCRAAGPRRRRASGEWPTRRSKVADAGRGSAARRTMASAARPATTMPSSSRAVRPSTMLGSCIRCRPSAGIWWTVKSTPLGQDLEERPALSAA